MLRHYFEVGEDALRLIVAALISAGRPFPKRILDFPSGSGRVTRHLRAFFPEPRSGPPTSSRTTWRSAPAFRRHNEVSREDFSQLEFDGEFDLVFCGSLLTHLTEGDAKAALAVIVRTLSPTGIALVTFHGRIRTTCSDISGNISMTIHFTSQRDRPRPPVSGSLNTQGSNANGSGPRPPTGSP